MRQHSAVTVGLQNRLLYWDFVSRVLKFGGKLQGNPRKLLFCSNICVYYFDNCVSNIICMISPIFSTYRNMKKVFLNPVPLCCQVTHNQWFFNDRIELFKFVV